MPSRLKRVLYPVPQNEDLCLLMRACPDQEFLKHCYDTIEANLGDIDPNFMGFLTDYVRIADMLTDHSREDSKLFAGRKWQIYDIGCAYGFQHVFFCDHHGYLGLAPGNTAKAFTPNAIFMDGRIEDVEEKIAAHIKNLPPDVTPFGIANMSIGHNRNKAMEAFDRLFIRKWVMY